MSARNVHGKAQCADEMLFFNNRRFLVTQLLLEPYYEES